MEVYCCNECFSILNEVDAITAMRMMLFHAVLQKKWDEQHSESSDCNQNEFMYFNKLKMADRRHAYIARTRR